MIHILWLACGYYIYCFAPLEIGLLKCSDGPCHAKRSLKARVFVIPSFGMTPTFWSQFGKLGVKLSVKHHLRIGTHRATAYTG